MNIIQTENKHNQHNLNNQKMETGPEEGQEIFQIKAKDQPTAEIMSGRQDRGPHKDVKEKKDIQKEQTQT